MAFSPFLFFLFLLLQNAIERSAVSLSLSFILLSARSCGKLLVEVAVALGWKRLSVPSFLGGFSTHRENEREREFSVSYGGGGGGGVCLELNRSQ